MVFERFARLMLTLIYGAAQWGYQAITHNFLLVIIFLILLIGLIKVYRKLREIEYRLWTIESDVNRRTQTEKSKRGEDGKERPGRGDLNANQDIRYPDGIRMKIDIEKAFVSNSLGDGSLFRFPPPPPFFLNYYSKLAFNNSPKHRHQTVTRINSLNGSR